MLSVSYLNSHTFREIKNQPHMWSDTYRIVLEKEKEIKSFMSLYFNEDVTVIFTGAGTSSFIGNILQFIMYRYNITNHKSVATTDITTHAESIFNKNKKYILVSFARSGNSPESIVAMELANSICGNNVAHIIITCNEQGELATLTDKENSLLLVLPPETNDKGLAMTSSFTSMLLASMMIFDINKIESKRSSIEILCNKASFLISHYASQIMKIASGDFQRAVFLGSGEIKGIAEECHLKLQELTDGKIICLFDSFLGFRHGPKAAINEKTILIYLFSDDEKIFQYEKDLVTQINNQEKPVLQLYFSQKERQLENIEFALEMFPEKEIQTEYDVLLYVLIGQLLGIFKSVELNLDPDNPSVNGKIARVVEGVTIYKG